MNELIHGRADTRLRFSIAVVGAAVAVAGYTTAASPAQLDASFVAAARADGRDVSRGIDQQATLVVAARKICARRTPRMTPGERRASALNLRELDAVGATFAGDGRRFADLALDVYCPP